MATHSILSVGPTFAVNALASASLEADATLSVDLAYTASGAKLYFPPNGGSSLGTFKPSDTSVYSLTKLYGGI